MKIQIDDYEVWHEADLEFPIGVASDPRLSLKAKGLLLVLAAHEGHPDADRTMLSAASKDGADAHDSALRELRDAGYLTVSGHGADRTYRLVNVNPVAS